MWKDLNETSLTIKLNYLTDHFLFYMTRTLECRTK